MVLEPLRALLEYVLLLDSLTAESVLALRHPLVTNAMTSVTGLGSVAAGLVLVGLFYLAGWREEFLVTLIALSITGAIVATLMAAIQRPFPAQPVCLTDGAGTPTTSFPSGHAAAVTVYAMVARSSETLPFKTVAALAAVVAVSRIYLGTHYLSDTVAGVAIGVGAVLLAERVPARVGTDALFRRLPT
jgi:membrane-associated phospholipid phosphatase